MRHGAEELLDDLRTLSAARRLRQVLQSLMEKTEDATAMLFMNKHDRKEKRGVCLPHT